MQKYDDSHEIEAEISARKIALRQTDSLAIAHMEAILSTILQSMDTTSRTAFAAALTAAETITPEEKEIVQLHGEALIGEAAKSKRQQWREEITELERQLQTASGLPENEAE